MDTGSLRRRNTGLALMFCLLASPDAGAAGANPFGEHGYLWQTLMVCGFIWVAMLFDRRTRAALVVPGVALAICAVPFLLIVSGSSGQSASLAAFAIVMLFAAPWILAAATAIALVIAVARGPAGKQQ